jgi:hypothetical protein
MGFLDYWITGLLDYWILGFLDYLITGFGIGTICCDNPQALNSIIGYYLSYRRLLERGLTICGQKAFYNYCRLDRWWLRRF